MSALHLLTQELMQPYYNEGHRHYHKLQHIQLMLDQYDVQFNEVLPVETYYAIWYHDAVYLPWSLTNEEDSVKLLQLHNCQYSLALDATFIDRISAMIIATKSHEVSDDLETNRLLDLDMMILGCDSLIYDRYVENTRLEYSFATDEQWATGRAKFLQSVIAKEKIFITPEMQKFNQPARENITRELTMLSS